MGYLVIELHVYLELAEGKGSELESIFRQDFVPAISRRKGFKQVRLLRKRGAPGEYEIDIVFSSEELRLEWVASPEHAAIWPRIAGLCRSVSSAGFEVCESAQ